MRAALLALLVVLGTLGAMPISAAGQSSPDQDDGPPDPDSDVIGWENGVWHNESIPVDQTGLGDTGLTERETELLVARTMARVEVLRQLEFTEDVNVEFISRAELRARLRNTSFGETTNDQLYEAMFVFGEDENATRIVDGFLGDAVLGYAAEEGSANLTIVTKSEDLHAVSERVLAHELVHVLQDQHFNLSEARYQRHTMDGEMGKDGLIEGEASYIDARYTKHCISNWTCTNAPSDWSGASVPDEAGTYSLLTSQPYNDGGTFVYDLKQSGGWEAVNQAHRDPPQTTEQIIHLDRNRSSPPLPVEDRSASEWEPYHTNTVGEAGLVVMFYAHRQRVPEGKEVMDGTPHERQHRWDTLDFEFEPTTGWANDTFRAYRNGDRRGFTWHTTWDTEHDAKEFAGAYEQALTGLDAWRYGENTYVIEEGPFADAYHVTRENATVTIVNAPSVEELRGVDAAVSATPNPYIEHLRERIETQNETIRSLREQLAAQNETISELQNSSTTTGDSSVETPSTPGFVVLALILVAVLLGRRSR